MNERITAVLSELRQFEIGAEYKANTYQDRADYYRGKASAYATARAVLRRDLLGLDTDPIAAELAEEEVPDA